VPVFSNRDPHAKILREFVSNVFGIKAKNITLYKKAVTHKSSSDGGEKGVEHNERLEFLGDAILGAVVGEYLFDLYPNEREGFLSQTRSLVVNRKQLNNVAEKLGVEKLMIHDADQEVGNSSITGNALEAIIGAVFLDHNYRTVKKAIIKGILKKHVDIEMLIKTEVNYKSKLLEWGQKEKKQVEFRMIGKTRLPQNDLFTICVFVDKESKGYGQNNSKKRAEQEAAMNTVYILNIMDTNLSE